LKFLFQKTLKYLFTPLGLILFTYSLSTGAWLFSDYFGLPKAYLVQEPIQLEIIIFFMWLFYISFPSYVGFKLGQKLPVIKELVKYTKLENPLIYKIYSLIAFSGFFATVYTTLKVLGFSGFVYSVVSFQTNHISEAIYSDYSVGVYSFRYILILSFGFAIYRILIEKKFTLIDLTNIIVFVFYITFFGRRLQLVASIFVFILLGNRNNRFFSILNFRTIMISGFLGFSLLIAATTLRNYGSYQNMGYSNPIIVTIANSAEYLAAPFQVSLGTSNNYMDALNKVQYQKYVDIKSSLTANGAFTHMTRSYGLTSLIIIGITCFLLATLAGWLSKQNTSYMFTALPIILYGFSELWRIELFYKGIFLTLLITSLGIPIAYAIFKTLFSKTYLQR
jgi:hypothetical protein